MAIDLKTVKAMEDADIGFVVNVRHPNGGYTFYLMCDEVENFIEDKDSVAASHFDLTTEEYLEWVETYAGIQCSAKTKSGARCKNVVSGDSESDPQKWKNRRNSELCAVHGGEGSKYR